MDYFRVLVFGFPSSASGFTLSASVFFTISTASMGSACIIAISAGVNAPSGYVFGSLGCSTPQRRKLFRLLVILMGIFDSSFPPWKGARRAVPLRFICDYQPNPVEP
jgi:hypothetical protein